MFTPVHVRRLHFCKFLLNAKFLNDAITNYHSIYIIALKNKIEIPLRKNRMVPSDDTY